MTYKKLPRCLVCGSTRDQNKSHSRPRNKDFHHFVDPTPQPSDEYTRGRAAAFEEVHELVKRFVKRGHQGLVIRSALLMNADRSLRDALRRLFEITEPKPYVETEDPEFDRDEVIANFLTECIYMFLEKHNVQELRFPEGIWDLERFIRSRLKSELTKKWAV